MRVLTCMLSIWTVLAFVTVAKTNGYRNDISDAFPLGIIGCLVSDVCGPNQMCEDDNLFGSCRSVDRLSLGIKYELMTSEYDRIGEELVKLKTDGYTWHDAFTQCILQNTLIAFAKQESINLKDYCEYALAPLQEEEDSRWSEDERKEIATVLERLLEANEMQQEPVFPDDVETWEDLRSNKRDEIVEVHKYFDKSKGLKRNVYPNFDDSPSNYLSDDPSYFEEEPSRIDETAFGSPGQVKAYLRVLDQLSDSAKQSGLFDPNYPLSEDINDEERGVEGSMISESEPNLDSLSESKVAEDNDIETSLETEALKKGGEEAIPQENEDYLTVAPPDEKALEDLMAGKVDPRDLDLDQLKRLMKIVEVMVEDLDNPDTEETPLSESEMMELVQIPDNSVVNGDDAISDDVIIPSRLEAPAVENLSLDKKAVVKEPKEEKAAEEEPKTTVKPEDVVDMRYTYIQLNRNIDEVEGGAFLEGFASIINLPTSAINDVMTFGDKITFEVLPNAKYNASMVANQADNDEVKEKLKSITGLTIVKAGIGKENQVEVKKNDNKYVVLTFILVGCIAGILLAVVVIYLIKRQSRSKEKLAELADNVEGNEASKDYQDLCRQRMQSKTSDKPEPLHAAGRIGSVSDNVRSPSSRSSTSSWSEEPVQSNMDISTGHIVLSYMEDHLNNQDRLDQEWEALSQYEAEPSSTKIATDASNMRKNRYGDILPYDHSRVVLNSAANVSSSDYINANFITDHDPRNPAFIVGQAPLPHTVADFWQMVWEQGSVVIVMLTKLTENGTAMCHRYWPEEGSDLYHIYEVHLVSEHIWCDDYLVRSFYLKNLQTNETRTVTQFHFLTWPNLGVPGSIKALLDFRRKVNKSYRGRSCPIVVHCSDGCDRSGTYILIDMVLNRMAKGAKEIDMAATLEHIRDQRMVMVKSKEQFQFALACVAEEVHAILKALPQ